MDYDKAKELIDQASGQAVEVKMSVARTGPVSAARGDVIEVAMLEAARMNRAGQIEVAGGTDGEAIRKGFAEVLAAAEIVAAGRPKAAPAKKKAAAPVAAPEAPAKKGGV